MRKRPASSLARAVFLAVLMILVSTYDSRAMPYKDRVYERVLANGLDLILLEDHKAPVAVFQVWYRVGSRNEVPGRTGLSHLLEHMMFKGTPTVAPEEYSRIIQRNGGQLNAFTSQDYTTYFATLASDRLHVVIGLEADRMANLIINDQLFVPERDVVKEERRLRTENEPVSDLSEQLSAAAYVEHPYGQPIIGWMGDISRLTTADLQRHYRTYYIPNNAFVIAAGDFDAEQLAENIETAFGPIPAGAAPPEVRAVEPEQRGERRVALRRPAELPNVVLAYHTPAVRSNDAAALDVLATVLGVGRSSRLYEELVYRRRLARSVYVGYEYTSLDPTLFTISAQPLPDRSTSVIEKALLEEIERIKTEGVTEHELQSARNSTEANFVFAQDSLFYQCLLLGQFEIAGNWRWVDEYVPQVRAVSAEDVLRVARFYLTSENRTVGTLIPEPGGAAPSGPAQPPGGPVQ